MTSKLLLVHRPGEDVSDLPPNLASLVRDATASEDIIIQYYHAIPGSFKRVPQSVGLVCYERAQDAESSVGRRSSGLNDRDDVAPTEVRVAEPLSVPSVDDGVTSTVGDGDAAPVVPHDRDPSSSTAISKADIVTWTNDDIDYTDYKNTPDYDPDQEESVYESTPEPDDPHATPDPPPFIDGYLKIYDSETETPSTAEGRPAPYIFLLFIPNVWVALSEATDSTHSGFLQYMKLYPCMTSLPSYARVSAFATEPTSTNRNYLVLQSFSSLEHRSEDWLALKRKEAKHWWRKEERGALGVKAGFFSLQSEQHIGIEDTDQHGQ